MMPMRWLGPHRVVLLAAGMAMLLVPSRSHAEQFVLFDVTFTFTKEDADNSKPSKSHYYVRGKMLNPDRPKDWTNPVDYRNGTVHIRTEVIEKPAGGEPTTWTLCYIPNKGQKNGYGCTSTGIYREKGVYEQDVKMTSFWQNDSIVWTEGIKQMDLVIKDNSGGGGHAHKRADWEKFFPTKMRITMIQVSAGSKYDPSLVPSLPGNATSIKDQRDRLAIGTAASRGDQWPAWRGPRGDGVSTERQVPLTWSATQNVRWKLALPEAGNSTPIVWDDHVFLTQALDGGKRRALLAVHRRTGERLWQQAIPCAVQETTHKQNPPCSASPVTDGQAVYADFASAGVVAYDFRGRQLWHRDLGAIHSRWGNGSSPILYKNLLIVFHGPGEPSTFLMALDKRTGQTVWKHEETAIDSPVFGSWSTPLVVRRGEHDELVMPLPGDRVGGEGLLKAYDPNTGEALWTCRGLGNEIYAMPTPSPAGDLLMAISGHNGPLLAVRPGGTGDVTASHRLWRVADKNPQRVGSGVCYEGRFYLADAPGFLECLDAQTGAPLWKERLEGNLWGSLLLANGRLYVSNLEGETFVVTTGARFQLLARNKIGEPTYAALAVSQGAIFLRTYQHLYCIEEMK